MLLGSDPRSCTLCYQGMTRGVALHVIRVWPKELHFMLLGYRQGVTLHVITVYCFLSRSYTLCYQGLLFHITQGVPLSNSLPRKFITELVTAAGGNVQPAGEKCWTAKRILDSQKVSYAIQYVVTYTILLVCVVVYITATCEVRFLKENLIIHLLQ